MRLPRSRRSRWTQRSAIERYYDARAAEYDATTYELATHDPSAAPDVAVLESLVAALPAANVLDVGCGTGWLTRLLRGRVVALDASPSMLRRARQRLPDAVLVLASAPPLPFLERSFERVFASHLYSHLDVFARDAFVRDVFRVADELILVEQPWRHGLPSEGREERSLRDGSVHQVYKRYLTAEALADELGGEVVLQTPTFVAVRSTRPGRSA
jgi:demethylmenaquinone methyltransferase/2-methoxy-6-polyprenyl-1,4-benzoquinol methylase